MLHLVKQNAQLVIEFSYFKTFFKARKSHGNHFLVGVVVAIVKGVVYRDRESKKKSVFI